MDNKFMVGFVVKQVWYSDACITVRTSDGSRDTHNTYIVHVIITFTSVFRIKAFSGYTNCLINKVKSVVVIFHRTNMLHTLIVLCYTKCSMLQAIIILTSYDPIDCKD
jgi:hypothetical protein